jgi:hypothetical protein
VIQPTDVLCDIAPESPAFIGLGGVNAAHPVLVKNTGAGVVSRHLGSGVFANDCRRKDESRAVFIRSWMPEIDSQKLFEEPPERNSEKSCGTFGLSRLEPSGLNLARALAFVAATLESH